MAFANISKFQTVRDTVADKAIFLVKLSYDGTNINVSTVFYMKNLLEYVFREFSEDSSKRDMFIYQIEKFQNYQTYFHIRFDRELSGNYDFDKMVSKVNLYLAEDFKLFEDTFANISAKWRISANK